MSENVSILFVGDVVGGIGKRTLLTLLPVLRDRFAPDFVIVNGENGYLLRHLGAFCFPKRILNSTISDNARQLQALKYGQRTLLLGIAQRIRGG